MIVLVKAAVCSPSVCLGVQRMTALNECAVHLSIYDVTESTWSMLCRLMYHTHPFLLSVYYYEHTVLVYYQINTRTVIPCEVVPVSSSESVAPVHQSQ